MLRSYLRLTRQTLFLCLFLPIVVTVCSWFIEGNIPATKFIAQVGLASLISLIGCVIIYRIFNLLEPQLQNTSKAQVRFVDELPVRWVPLAILASAFGGLALELAIIRWQGTVWEIFAFYKNFGLLSCFAGLGIGYSLARRDRIPLLLSFPLLALQALVLVAMRHGMTTWQLTSLVEIPFKEQLHMGFDASVSVNSPPHLIAVYVFLGTVMLLTALAFVPIGQISGRLLERSTALKAYGLNLAGSILGTLAMLALSMLWTPPTIWFVFCFVVLLVLQVFDRRVILIGTLSALVTIIVLNWPVSFLYERVYSPYQLLERGRGDHGLTMIRAAGHYFQRIHNLSTDAVAAFPEREPIRNYYELPYHIQPNATRVAIVGAGTGNDVAAALRSNVAHVDAIEIDPAILKIGAFYHPEQPYDDKRVTIIINDARTFLRGTTNSYDMIVYGLLDSHTLLSHASSVRLDSFVYTVEGIRDARSRLVDDGIVSLSFSVLSPELGRKIYLMMKEAFDGISPVCIRAKYDGSIIFLQSKTGNLRIDPKILEEAGFKDVSRKYRNPKIHADVSTDDWPFFYMPQRIYPVSYVWMLALILFISVVMFWSFLEHKPRLSHAAYFFMGAGFMLVETKAITELGLMFGNTWQVIGIVILAVLIMAYLANLAVMKFSLRRTSVPLILLILSLFIGIIVAKAGGMPATPIGQLMAVIILTVPMFFSGIAFSSLLAGSNDTAGALAMNLLGAMCGGLLEYNSMYFGFQFLYWIAIALYGFALISSLILKRE
jgi:spermidine synthase